MTSYFDLLGAQNRDHGERGIARLISQLALALERSHPTAIDRYIVHPHLPVPQSLEPLYATGKLVRSDLIDERPSSGGTFIAGSVVELEESMQTVLPSWARGSNWQSYAILFDLIPLRFSDRYLSDHTLRSRYLDRIAGYGLFDRLLPISATSEADAVELINFPSNRQTVIYAGVDDRFRPAGPGTERPSIDGLRDGYVLFPTGMDWRKNVDRTIEAYAALAVEVRENHQLVLACRLDPWMVEALQEQAHRLGIAPDQLLLPGYLDDGDLVSLYQHAALAIFPSLYEGFGLPVLEAMQCGTPTICADNSSLREVQTAAEARFDAGSTESITDALHRALTDSTLRDRLLQHPVPDFSWERSASLLVGALGTEPSAPQRARLAIVSPVPPQPSGIANYTGRLARELSKLVDVTVFSSVNEEEGDVDFDPIDGVTVRALDELADLHYGGQPFDRILYMMGNSRFHAQGMASLRRTGGAVLFHDARFTGLYNEMYRLSPESFGSEHVGAKLAALYPDRYRPAVSESHTIAPEQAHRFGIQMSIEIAGAASHRFCHSDYAARSIHIDSGTTVRHLFDLPLPARESVGPLRRDDLVSAFGIVDPLKQPGRLVEAMGLLGRPSLTLRFVGDCDRALEQTLRDKAELLGVTVEFTGYVSEDELLAQQQLTAIAVQLRAHSNGESSGALAELLAAQTPTIATRIGALAELPADAVRFVEPDAPASEIARALGELLDDPHATLRMQEAARRYAESNSYEAAAQALARALDLI